jgi:hypothetical protein
MQVVITLSLYCQLPLRLPLEVYKYLCWNALEAKLRFAPDLTASRERRFSPVRSHR